jgi:hypothetical protein
VRLLVSEDGPFGGWKRSLFGDTQVHGVEGAQFSTRARW